MIPQEINQVAKGLSRVITALQEKDNFIKLLKIFLEETQELEVANIELAEQKNISIAEGIWLDYIGGIVGEERKGRSDLIYRSALRTRVGINVSDATPNNIISITKEHTASLSSKIIEYYPAAFFSVVTGSQGLDSSLFALLQGIKPAGASVTLVSNLNDTRFLPTWLNSLVGTTIEQAFELDLEDNLLLDDGSDPLDFLDILAEPSEIFATPPELAKLAWLSEQSFEVNNSGTVEPLELSIGGTLDVVTIEQTTPDRGLLSQVITQDTKAL